MFFQLGIAHTHTHVHTSCNFGSFSSNKTTIVRSHLLLFYCHFLEKVPHSASTHVHLFSLLIFFCCFRCRRCLIQRSGNACECACRHKRFCRRLLFFFFLVASQSQSLSLSSSSLTTCVNQCIRHLSATTKFSHITLLRVSLLLPVCVCVCVMRETTITPENTIYIYIHDSTDSRTKE